MIKRIIGCLMLSTLLASCNLFYHKADIRNSELLGIIPVTEQESGAYAMEARYSNWPNPDTLIIYIDGIRHKMTSEGSILNGENEVTYNLGNEFPVEQLYFIQRGRDMFFFYTDVNEDGAGSFVKRMSLDTGETIWAQEIDGFSFSKPLVRGQFAYIGTIGFIGKMKLKSGTFDWKYSGLGGSKGRFNQFREIDFPNEKQVRFVSPHPFSFQSDTVVVNDMTGEIVKMN
ncbi:MAG: hypothetical protein MJZ01_05460 [Bacteroidales bacterium]|nr:hypothetical protein [Bacteroidales bacterium]